MTRCPVCGESAVEVSPQSTPEIGALDLGGHKHRHAGSAYYHSDGL